MIIGARELVVLKDITSIEELTDVSTDVLLDNEGATRVLILELGNVKHEVIQDTELFSALNSSLEFLKVNNIVRLFEGSFTRLDNTEANFNQDT